MKLRSMLLCVAALALAGCASEPAPQVLGYQSRIAAPVTSALPEATPPPLQKTLASRMLAAIALERVTGRKPDPARLAEVR